MSRSPAGNKWCSVSRQRWMNRTNPPASSHFFTLYINILHWAHATFCLNSFLFSFFVKSKLFSFIPTFFAFYFSQGTRVDASLSIWIFLVLLFFFLRLLLLLLLSLSECIILSVSKYLRVQMTVIERWSKKTISLSTFVRTDKLTRKIF